MKIWRSYGSDHSANLLMIGHFKTASDAESALKAIEQLQVRAGKDEAEGRIDCFGGSNKRYPDALLDVARELNFWDLTPSDYASFVFDLRAKQVENRLEFWTDDTEILGYVKLLIDRGAKVEIFSLHDYPASDEAQKESDKSGVDG